MSSRFTILGTLASGGMGTVYLARMTGSAGFSRLVAIKRLNAELAAKREFIAMLVDEARLTSQVRHVNVIDTLDLVASDGAFSLVLEYVEGASLSALISAAKAAREPIPEAIAISIVRGMLRGLDAAHEARSQEGQPLNIVHRDVSPQNVLVGVDGIPRLIDFGIAKAMGKMTSTRPGEIRGKFSYMAPEQLLERPATRQADVYAAGVLLWELLTNARLFVAEDARAVIASVLEKTIQAPSSVNPNVSKELDAIVLKATARELSERFESARDMIEALSACSEAPPDEVGSWVRQLAAPQLAKRGLLLQNVVPEASRSVESLLEELEQSGKDTSDSRPSKSPSPASERAGNEAPSNAGAFVAPLSISNGGTSKGMKRHWLALSAAGVVTVVLTLGILIGMRRQQTVVVVPTSSSSPPQSISNASLSPPASSIANVAQTQTQNPPDDGPPLPAASSSSSMAATAASHRPKHFTKTPRPAPSIKPTSATTTEKPDPDKDHR